MKKEFLVEVTISFPNGESLDDWKLVGRMVEDVKEGTVTANSLAIGSKIARQIERWCKESATVPAVQTAQATGGFQPLDDSSDTTVVGEPKTVTRPET